MSGLLSTISRAWPGVADDAFVLLERDGANTYDPAVSVADELATIDSAGVILVDDLHLAAPAPATLAAFVEALPERFRFVAGTRPIPRCRCLGSGCVATSSSSVATTSGSWRRSCPTSSLSTTCPSRPMSSSACTSSRRAGRRRPAGRDALQGGAAREEFLDAFASTDRAVSDFLLSEVLSNLPPDLAEFLVETSVLEAFDAELCFAVTGNEESGALLERVLAANLFVVPVGERAGWYRYHHLFGAFLRSSTGGVGGFTAQVGPRAGEPRAGATRRHLRGLAPRDGRG